MHKPRTAITTKKRPKQRGKQFYKWQEIRAEWIKNHPAPYYICYLCGVQMDVTALTLDHVIPKSNAANYSKRHDDANLEPACYTCNGKKGSRHGKETY